MKFIVGLGNPGRAYEMTRHNIGFLVLDELANRAGLSFRRSWRFPARIANGELSEEAVRLVKPQTYMNRSGQVVETLLRKGRGSLSDLVVIYDDVALDWGRLRVRARGSAGGHNGVKSLLDSLQEDSFGRIRVGIGSKPDKVSLPDHVLGPFSASERDDLPNVVGRAADAVEQICAAGIERAMNQFN